MTKYDPLHTILKKRIEPEIKLTFAEVERILRAPLPATARQRNQWWANDDLVTFNATPGAMPDIR